MRTNASGLGLGFRPMPKRMTKAGSPPFNSRFNLAGKPLPTLREPSPVTIRFECPRCRGAHPAYECPKNPKNSSNSMNGPANPRPDSVGGSAHPASACPEAVLSAGKRQPADDTP
jgi:hypothetical protein